MNKEAKNWDNANVIKLSMRTALVWKFYIFKPAYVESKWKHYRFITITNGIQVIFGAALKWNFLLWADRWHWNEIFYIEWNETFGYWKNARTKFQTDLTKNKRGSKNLGVKLLTQANLDIQNKFIYWLKIILLKTKNNIY